jgi:hypothetical protein
METQFFASGRMAKGSWPSMKSLIFGTLAVLSFSLVLSGCGSSSGDGVIRPLSGLGKPADKSQSASSHLGHSGGTPAQKDAGASKPAGN